MNVVRSGTRLSTPAVLGWAKRKKISKCNTLPEGEIFYNRHFDCGLDYWELDPNYGGTVVDNGDSTVTLTATEQWSSLTQSKSFPISVGNYHVGVVVTSITGKGKMSYKLQDGTWHNAFTFDAAGTYEADITADQDIIMFDIGADDDPSAVITFDGVSCMDAAIVHYPDWWNIASLDDADILGAWDFDWVGIDNTATAKTTLTGVMPSFENAIGGPVWRQGQGITFGGGGALKSLLPDGIDVNNITTIVQVNGVVQNATLDAFYSHYKSSSHYTHQNGWADGVQRWSCGDGSSTTVTGGSLMRNGVITTSGRDLYQDGSLIATVPESGEALTSGDNFILGGIELDDGRIVQMIRGNILKVLIVGRTMTEAEVQEIVSNMTGGIVVNHKNVVYDGKQVTYDGKNVIIR